MRTIIELLSIMTLMVFIVFVWAGLSLACAYIIWYTLIEPSLLAWAIVTVAFPSALGINFIIKKYEKV